MTKQEVTLRKYFVLWEADGSASDSCLQRPELLLLMLNLRIVLRNTSICNYAVMRIEY